MNPEIKEARSNVLKQREEFEAKIIAPAEALEKLSDEALEGVAGGGYWGHKFDDVVSGGTVNGDITIN